MKDSNKIGNYEKLGVSHSKDDVHAAIKDMDKGLYPDAFCKVMEDVTGDPEYCSIFHSDSAGTKASLAYMMHKETGNLDYFKGIVQDAIVMNVDDVLCVGADGNALISDTIGRNKKLISGEIISVLINEHADFAGKLSEFGFGLKLAGGETEDVGDLLRTLEVGVSLFARIPRSKVITGESVQNNDVIIGLESCGQSTYEDKYNSGIGSNGLTLARHGTLNHEYYDKYPMCYDPHLEDELVFFGKHNLLDPVKGTPLTVGEALLSPTKTYAPILVEVLEKYRDSIHAIFHNTGGGQTKCLHFGKNRHYIKDDLLEIPPIFHVIQDSSNTSWREMFQVFNMGHRLELILPEEFAKKIMQIASQYDVKASIIGHVEIESSLEAKNKLSLSSAYGDFEYS